MEQVNHEGERRHGTTSVSARQKWRLKASQTQSLWWKRSKWSVFGMGNMISHAFYKEVTSSVDAGGENALSSLPPYIEILALNINELMFASFQVSLLLNLGHSAT